LVTRVGDSGIDLGVLWRGRNWIVLGLAAGLLMSLTAELMLSPRYRAVSQILIGPVDLRVVEKQLLPGSQSSDTNVLQVESETRILTSDRVLRRVVESEHLTDDPEFGVRGVSSLGRLISRLRIAIGLPSDALKLSDAELAALRQLQRDVTAKRTERTYVVDLIVETSDPDKSARIANAIAGAYVNEQSAARTEAARRATDSLDSRLNELRERVRQAEERYKNDQNIVGAGGRLVDEQQLTDFNSQLIAARGRTAEAKARYEQSLAIQRSGAEPGNTSEAVQSNTVGRLREQYATIARQEANLTAELGPRHPYVIEARAQARNAQRLITEEVGRVADANKHDYERAAANENALAASFDTLKRKAMNTNLAFVKLRELEREVDANKTVYESFLVRAREIREQEQLDTINVRVLSDAQPPQDRSFPPRRLILLLASLIVGGLGGMGCAYAADLWGRRPRPVEVAVPHQARLVQS
jgi:succinoglycan biosynthesis transport protein ExoP